VEKPAFSAKRFATCTLVFAALTFVIPFPYYWWSLWSGGLLPEAQWWAQGTNHGPWRWALPGMALVLLPLYTLSLGSAAVLVYGAFKSFRVKTAVPVFAALPIAAAYLILAFLFASQLFWTID
jgi:hypothetical protein